MTELPAAPPDSLVARCREFRQDHLWMGWDTLSESARSALVQQLESLDLIALQRLYQQFICPARSSQGAEQRIRSAQPPADLVRLPQSEQACREWEVAAATGAQLLADGKVAAILVAGGEGSRLGVMQPKGMHPIGPVSGKSLFQFHCEQLRERERRAAAAIPYLIMTSATTHAPTVEFFAANNYFGLGPERVVFFQQGTMPVVDVLTGRFLLAEFGKICVSPDGHGGMLAALNSAGLFDRLREWGIEYLYYHQVDNPAARICDPAFLGWHALREAQVSTKVVRKRNAEEKMGVAVDLEGRTQIIEYSDLSPELTGQNNAQGELLFWAGSTAMHVFSTQYLARLVEDEVELPWHVARKIVSHVDRDGKAITPVEPNACKFERFIFDILPLADRALIVEADRQREFHPVKNASGSDSADSVRAALSKLHRRWLEESGALVEEGAVVELSARLVLDLDSGF